MTHFGRRGPSVWTSGRMDVGGPQARGRGTGGRRPSSKVSSRPDRPIPRSKVLHPSEVPASRSNLPAVPGTHPVLSTVPGSRTDARTDARTVPRTGPRTAPRTVLRNLAGNRDPQGTTRVPGNRDPQVAQVPWIFSLFHGHCLRRLLPSPVWGLLSASRRLGFQYPGSGPEGVDPSLRPERVSVRTGLFSSDRPGSCRG